jgi:hypothetical protein
VSELLDTNIFSSEYLHYKIFIHEKCLENENYKFHKSLSRPSIIDARAHYWAAVGRLRSIDVELLASVL